MGCPFKYRTNLGCKMSKNAKKHAWLVKKGLSFYNITLVVYPAGKLTYPMEEENHLPNFKGRDMLVPWMKFCSGAFPASVIFQKCGKHIFQTLGIQSYSQMMSKGCPITETKRIVFRFQYHSQEVIGSLGKVKTKHVGQFLVDKNQCHGLCDFTTRWAPTSYY